MKNILLLHGSAGSKNNFIYLEKELEKEFKITTFDLIGYGDEKKPNVKYDINLFINFIGEKMNPEMNYIVVGHSLGAILAKELAIRFHKQVQKVFLINYPMDKSKVVNHWWSGIFLRKTIIAKCLCHTKMMWKFLLYPYFYVFDRKYFSSFKDYFKHSFNSESSTLENVFMKDNLRTLEKIKKKVVIISGEKDLFVDKKVVQIYENYIVNDMGHSFFNHEKEIANIIKKNTK